MHATLPLTAGGRRHRWASWTALVVLLASVIVWRLQSVSRSPAPRVSAPKATPLQRAAATAAPVVPRPAATARLIVGNVRNTNDNAVARATVCAAVEPASLAAPQCTLSDASGRFSLVAASGDSGVFLVASAAGYVPRRQQLSLPASGGEEPIVITLESGGVEVSGQIIDASGGAVPSATVSLRSQVDDLTLTVFSNTNGEFSASVAEGDLLVLVGADAYSGAARRVHAPARGITFVLAPGASIRGRVVAAHSEEPLAGVTVVATLPQDALELPYTAVTNADGEFAIDGLSGGAEYQTTVSSPAWHAESVSVRTEVGRASTSLLLRAVAATTLSGTVWRDRQPCAGARVSARGPALAVGYSGADGVAQLGGLAPGPYEVAVHCPGALPLQERLEIRAAPVHRDWRVESGAAVSGRVESERGAPLPDVMVSVQPAGDALERAPSNCRTDASGSFRCAGLVPGVYDCSVADVGGPERQVVRVTLGAGADARVVLRALASGTIHVSVSSAQRELARELKVFARGSDKFPYQARTTRDGFVFERMPLGTYQLYVDLPNPTGEDVEARLERDGERVDVQLVAPTALTIDGRAVEADGAPCVDAWVSASASDGTSRFGGGDDALVLSDDGGHFTLSELSPGSYDLLAKCGSDEAVLRGVSAGTRGVVVRPVKLALLNGAAPSEPAPPPP